MPGGIRAIAISQMHAAVFFRFYDLREPKCHDLYYLFVHHDVERDDLCEQDVSKGFYTKPEAILRLHSLINRDNADSKRRHSKLD